MKILKTEEQIEKQLQSKDGILNYSVSSTLSEKLCTEDFFITREKIEPGHSSSAPHYHLETDELVYVLEGEVVLEEGNETQTLKKGETGCFSKLAHIPHVIKNFSHQTSEVLVIKRKLEEQDVVFTS